MDRRSFLKVSSVTSAYACAISVLPGDVISKDAPEDSYQHIYLVIHPDNSMTMHSPIAEMGQFMRTTGPMILAEEAELPWENISFSHKTPLHLTKDAEDNLSYQFADLDTGGSYAVKRNWDPLRKIGTLIKQQFQIAGSIHFKSDIADCECLQGVITHRPSGRRITYGEVAQLASQQPIEFDAAMLKQPKDYSLIGNDVCNIDIDDLVTGKPVFGLDAEYEGALQTVILRSPVLGATAKLLNKDDVLKMPGIKGIEIVPIMIDNHWMSGKTSVVPSGVAVLAENLWQAIQGRAALKVEWLANAEFAGQDSEQQIAQFHKLVDDPGAEKEEIRNDGDVDAAMAQCDIVLDEHFEKPLLAHAAMEPFSCIADISEIRARIVVGHQFPKQAVEFVAEITGKDPLTVEYIGKRMGGGFGRRARKDFPWEAIWLSHKIKKPVKVTWLRQDDFEQDYFGPAVVTRIKAGLDKNNKLHAWHHVQAHTKGYSQHGSFPSSLVKNYKVEHCKTDSHIRAGAWRGPFHLQWAFPAESMLDMLAHKAGVDPLEFRLGLMKPHKDHPFPNWGAENINSGRMAACYEACAKAANWHQKRPQGTGLGIAGHFVHGSYAAFVVEVSVTINNQLTINHAWGAIDCGIAINPNHIRNQMEGGFIEGLNAALFNKMTVENSEVQQKNFHQLHWMRLRQAPKTIETVIIDSSHSPTGVGEPPTAPAAAALANAIYAASGKRLTTMPFQQYFTV